MMTYYPILIPTLCRVDHFMRCVESLSKCTHANNTELVIGLDYPLTQEHYNGYNKILNYIPTINGFKKVTLLKREKNFGPMNNVYSLQEYAWKNYDACIIVEDDTEYSPCFLDFINKCLYKYKDNMKITSVGGYLQSEYYKYIPKGQKTLCLRGSNAWGYAIWKDKYYRILRKDNSYFEHILHSFTLSWKIFKTHHGMLNMLIIMLRTHDDYDDVKYGIVNVLEDRYQLRPTFSLVRNWGNDGSGEHSGINPKYKKEKILEQDSYDIDDIEINDIKSISKISSWIGIGNDFFARLRFIITLIYSYTKYRL